MSTPFSRRIWSVVVTVLLVSACQGAGHGDSRKADDKQVDALPKLVDVDKRTEGLFEQALTAMQDDRYRDAELLLVELTDRDPRLSGPWANLGVVRLELGDQDGATEAFQRAIEINPHNCSAYNQLGVIMRQAGDFGAAEANYLSCVERVPEFREAYLNLGILYELYLGRLPQALDAYRTYQSLLDGPDRRVSAWVMDLERRLGASG